MTKRTFVLENEIDEEREVNEFFKELPLGGIKKTIINLVLRVKNLDKEAYAKSFKAKKDREFINDYLDSQLNNQGKLSESYEQIQPKVTRTERVTEVKKLAKRGFTGLK